MRLGFALALSIVLAVGSAAAQQPGEGSGIGPGQPPPSSLKEGPPPTAGCDPSFGGKYTGLVRRLEIPEDERQYGRCKDYGAWSGTDYKGHTNLPPHAFWTYSAPYWYVWANRAGAAAGCADPTFGGKYAGELRRLPVPQDRARYGTCRDYGPWAGNSYAGHTDLPNGYWVYSFPEWIIYGRRTAP
ncbi:MAG: hypothetical protein KIT16_24080 [Rhodospirillaceae bacterium]|nr:hypothetical protein [Rhodospirillaceae bacterium]